MTFSITTLSITTLSITTLGITTLSLTTLSLKGLFETLSTKRLPKRLYYSVRYF
jgi:hypothetical protein